MLPDASASIELGGEHAIVGRERRRFNEEYCKMIAKHCLCNKQALTRKNVDRSTTGRLGPALKPPFLGPPPEKRNICLMHR